MVKFQTSLFKNQILNNPKLKDSYFNNLSSSLSTSSNSIKFSSEHLIAKSSRSGELICLPFEKQTNDQPITLSTGLNGIVTEFDLNRFNDSLALTASDGRIHIHSLPSITSFNSPSSQSTTSILTISTSSSPIQSLSFHPTTSSLLLSSSTSTIYIHDINSSSTASSSIYEIKGEEGKSFWESKWSEDGRFVSGIEKGGILKVWDVRTDSRNAILQTQTHSSPSLASTHLSLPNSQYFTTGFSKSRDREYALFDTRSFDKPLKMNRVDGSGGNLLIPVLDEARGIVYLAGKGDSTIRFVEVGGSAVLTEGATPLPHQIQSLSVLPSPHLNLLACEINRIYLTTKDSIIPISVTIPRRSYLDFIPELFPAYRSFNSSLTSEEWKQGVDGELEKVEHALGVRGIKLSKQNKISLGSSTSTSASTSIPAPMQLQEVIPSSITAQAVALVPVSVPVSTPEVEEKVSTSNPILTSTILPTTSTIPTGIETVHTSANSSISTPTTPAQVLTPVPTPSTSSITTTNNTVATKSTPSVPSTSTPISSSTSATTPLKPSAISKPTLAATGTRFNPNWSRKFITGKTNLKPDYFGLNGVVSSVMKGEMGLLKANHLFAFFPLSGSGGRLAFHPLELKGRFPNTFNSISIGTNIVDFELDLFNPMRVFIGGDDGGVRVVDISEGGEGGEVVRVLSDSKMDKFTELKPHPTASDLLLTISDDFDNSTIRLWNISTGEVMKKIELGSELGGISSAAWSPDGSYLAVAAKSKSLQVFDPRSYSTNDINKLECQTHDSQRLVKVIWSSDSELVTTGFSKTAMREISLYSLTSSTNSTTSNFKTFNQLTKIGTESLDVSPAPLFPFVDLDTNILFLYSKGERLLHLFELNSIISTNSTTTKPFSKLPSFENGTLQIGFSFGSKKRCDIKGIELVNCLRLTKETLEIVRFTVPRAKVQFFQDDIFIPTRDTEISTLTASEWINGMNVEPRFIDLKPDGLELLSKAPATVTKGSTRSLITGPILTESQIQEAYMARMFAAAKVDEEKEEKDEEVLVRSANAVVDDDDW